MKAEGRELEKRRIVEAGTEHSETIFEPVLIVGPNSDVYKIRVYFEQSNAK